MPLSASVTATNSSILISGSYRPARGRRVFAHAVAASVEGINPWDQVAGLGMAGASRTGCGEDGIYFDHHGG